MYRFAVDSPTQNYYRNTRCGPNVRGVCHSDEISYLFKNEFVDVPNRDSMEFKSIERFVSVTFSFYHNLIFLSFRFLFSHPLQAQEIPTRILLALIWRTLDGNQLIHESRHLNV